MNSKVRLMKKAIAEKNQNKEESIEKRLSRETPELEDMPEFESN
jgi:guanylate kinase